MGTILFIILRLANLINTPLDWPTLCLLISLDSIAGVNLLALLQGKK